MYLRLPCAPDWVRSDDVTRTRTDKGWRYTRTVWFYDARGEKDCAIEEWEEPDET